ncbi:MAG: hypothetical protein M2R45_00252 [Verrucomicrobia subdivision 3 bacterium]|nr:hypothetical protein [Limisphaerales bacterium]MCS1412988.1 hypothetical protein [Limisphaerales bacterium]
MAAWGRSIESKGAWLFRFVVFRVEMLVEKGGGHFKQRFRCVPDGIEKTVTGALDTVEARLEVRFLKSGMK